MMVRIVNIMSGNQYHRHLSKCPGGPDLPNPVVDSAVDCIFCHSINAGFIMLCGQPSQLKTNFNITFACKEVHSPRHHGEVRLGRSASNGWLGGRRERNIIGGFHPALNGSICAMMHGLFLEMFSLIGPQVLFCGTT